MVKSQSRKVPQLNKDLQKKDKNAIHENIPRGRLQAVQSQLALSLSD